MNQIELIKNKFRKIPDYPIKGVTFQDITPVLLDKDIKNLLIDKLLNEAESDFFPKYDYIAGIESRGFIFASIISDILEKGLILVRKAGKLPPPVISTSYSTEYSETILEICTADFPKNAKVLILDDILATGGTLKAAANLIQKLGGSVSGFLVIGEISNISSLVRNAGIEELEKIAKVSSLFTF
jgi:adenine phosphoribosyltransferase